jgi:2-polyprenyl-3-methyl-5-hydroxy-6-metoxy-1,4-benzoquinol methylase
MRNCPICNSDGLHIIVNLKLSLVEEICLGDNLIIKYCDSCNFYFSDSGNSQEDYNKYYLSFNNYQNQNYCLDKDERCADFINKNIKCDKTRTLLDYGSGNGILAGLLSPHFDVDTYDIGNEVIDKKYDCLILSHVLEHIFDLPNFMSTISKNISDDGVLYIEIPNADFYESISDLSPLQEINIEHINFFTKYALNKLLVNNGFYSLIMQDDYFMLKNSTYFVIRGVFRKAINNNSFVKYLGNGLKMLSEYRFHSLAMYENIYVYGCGQLLFKIFEKIARNSNITNIIDDNPCYLGKKINNIEVINYETFQTFCKDGDTLLLTTLIHDKKIREKLLSIDKKLNILTMSDL